MRGAQFSMGVFEEGRLGSARRLHGVAPGPKVLGMFLLSGLAALLWRIVPPWTAAVTAGALLASTVALVVWAGFSVRQAVRWALPAVWVVGAITAVRWIGPTPSSSELGEMTAQGLSVIMTVLLARLFVATTRTTDLIDAIVRWVEPLRPLGAKPETFALAVSLVIRSVPVIGGSADAAVTAHRARGLPLRPRTLLVPLGMNTVASTIALSEALSARMLPYDASAARPTDSKDS